MSLRDVGAKSPLIPLLSGCSDAPNGERQAINGKPGRDGAEGDALAALLAERAVLTERVRVLVAEKGSLEAEVRLALSACLNSP